MTPFAAAYHVDRDSGNFACGIILFMKWKREVW